MSNLIFMFMSLKEIVKHYQVPTKNGVEVDIKALAADSNFREEVIKGVLALIKEKPQACVLIPAFKSTSERHHLGQLINELALTLQVKKLVTGDVRNFLHLKVKPDEVIILKQSFREGKELKRQISALESMGCKVSVICFMAHSAAKAKSFAEENKVPLNILVSLAA